MYNAIKDVIGCATTAFMGMYAVKGMEMLVGASPMLDKLSDDLMMFGVIAGVVAVGALIAYGSFRGIVKVGEYIAEAVDADDYC